MKKLLSIVISILFAFSMTGLAVAQGQDRPAPAGEQMKAEQKAPKAEKKKAKKSKKSKKVKNTKKVKKAKKY